MTKKRLALNLSKTSIQLLIKGSKKNWNVIGSADPSSKNLEKDLSRLKNQAAALSTKKPIVDILLPRELVLSQTIVIEDGFSIEYCKKITAERCGLNESEILIAIGDSSTRSTVPIAAISTNSITESRNFVKKAGFRPGRYIASSKISGFKKSPVFLNDNSSKQLFDLESTAYTKYLAFTSILLFAGFLVSLASAFLEYRSNNKPYNYLASSRDFYNKENNEKTEFILLRKAKKISRLQLDISNFQLKDKNLIYIPQKPKSLRPNLNSLGRFSIGRQLRANIKTIEIEELTVGEKIVVPSIPGKPNQFNDFRQMSNLSEKDLLSLFDKRRNNLHGTHPKMGKGLSISSNKPTLLLEKSNSVSSTLETKKVIVSPKRESTINHKYKKILIEEVFSDISLTKILITTANKRASTLPLLYFDTKKPDILNPDKLTGVNYINKENDALIRPMNIEQNKMSPNMLVSFDDSILPLNQQFNLKLRDQGINVRLLNNSRDTSASKLVLWNGKKPISKPKLIDAIKVLDDPTKSTGAVTFVELPPEIPLIITKLKRVSPSSIKNLNVRTNPPSIPKRSSIVGNSTLKNLIELNRTNLIGVFGKRTGRIALIRLSSGNTVKVSVGQKFGNGWRVISIDLDKIHITNGIRQETLRIPG